MGFRGSCLYFRENSIQSPVIMQPTEAIITTIKPIMEILPITFYPSFCMPFGSGLLYVSQANRKITPAGFTALGTVWRTVISIRWIVPAWQDHFHQIVAGIVIRRSYKPPLAQTLEAKNPRGCTKGAFSDWRIIERSVRHMRKGIIPTGFQMVWKKVLPNEAIHRILRIVNNDALKTANPKGSRSSSNMGMGRRGPVRMTV